jgi:hypothetical protein
MDDNTKEKLIDGAKVAAKSAGYLVSSVMLSAGRGAIIPRPINMWKNQRRERAIREAVEETGIPLDFKVKITRLKDGKVLANGVISTWMAWNWRSCSKWELAYDLFRFKGSFLIGKEKEGLWRQDTRVRFEIVDD